MKKYRVMLNGQHFYIEMDGKLEKVGFYTTRWVEAENPEEAELKAVALVRQDHSLNISVRNERDNPPMIYLDTMSEVDSFDGPGGGYSFYPDKGNKKSHN